MKLIRLKCMCLISGKSFLGLHKNNDHDHAKDPHKIEKMQCNQGQICKWLGANFWRHEVKTIAHNSPKNKWMIRLEMHKSWAKFLSQRANVSSNCIQIFRLIMHKFFHMVRLKSCKGSGARLPQSGANFWSKWCKKLAKLSWTIWLIRGILSMIRGKFCQNQEDFLDSAWMLWRNSRDQMPKWLSGQPPEALGSTPTISNTTTTTTPQHNQQHSNNNNNNTTQSATQQTNKQTRKLQQQ